MTWQAVPRANFMFLHAARLQAHYAVQWLARAARAYLAKQPDDGHTALRWDEGFGGLVTQPMPDGCRLGLRVADLTLVFVSGRPAELPLDGRAEAEVRNWLAGELAARHLEAAKLDDAAPYDLPEHALSRGARYSLDELGAEFQVLTTWFGNAHRMLGAVQRRLAARGLRVQPVRAWPHHFDMDCVVKLDRSRTVGIGYCPGDEFCDEPYFYTSMWPEPFIPSLPLLPAMAHWHTYKFLAALAPAHKIVAAHDQAAYVRQYLDVAVKAALDALR